MRVGTLWAVDAYGCDPAALRSQERLAALVADGGLHPLAAGAA